MKNAYLFLKLLWLNFVRKTAQRFLGNRQALGLNLARKVRLPEDGETAHGLLL